MRRLLPLVLVAMVSVAGGGCDVSDAFTCSSNDQCVLGGQHGFCEVGGACSFLDATCAGGRRYGEFSPGGVGGQCVMGPGGPDAPITVDAPPAVDAPLSI